MKLGLFTFALVISSATAAQAATSLPLKGSSLLPQAKVSLKTARHAAIEKEHGTIVDQELETENGGLRYSFDVKVGNQIHEVGVDAVTGKIVEDTIDNGND